MFERIDVEFVELIVEHDVGDRESVHLVDQVAQMPAQHRTRPDLQEHSLAHVERTLNSLVEEDRLAHIAPPVAGVEGWTGHNCVRDSRKERHGSARRREIGQAPEKRRLHGPHERSMKRIGKVQPLHSELLRPSRAIGERPQRFHGSGDHDTSIGIVSRDGERGEFLD